MPRSRRHALGQHFLASSGVLRKIVGVIDPRPDDVMVEVGPGRGALTLLLAERAGRIVAVEKDARLVPELVRSAPPNVEVVHADILRIDLRAVRDRTRASALRVVGNVPYAISTPLLFKVLDEREALSDGVLLLQKEVAERVTAGPGAKGYAPLGILLQNEFEASIELLVEPGSFSPPPRVRSALLTLRRRAAPLLPGAAEEPFRAFLRSAFAERRKTLLNSLARRHGTGSLDAALDAHGLRRDVRAEDLPAEVLFALFNALTPKPLELP